MSIDETVLSKWGHLLKWPQSINCPEMRLIGKDFEDSVAVGSGTVTIRDPQNFEYEMVGSPTDVKLSLRRLREAQAVRYGVDARSTLRLLFVDADGQEFNAGWTVPDVEPLDENSWRFKGETDGVTGGGSLRTHGFAGCIAVYEIPRRNGSFIYLSRFCAIRHEIEVLGSRIQFRFAPESQLRIVTATHAEGFGGPFAENWLGEPLRIMFGQLLYPKLVARICTALWCPVIHLESKTPR